MRFYLVDGDDVSTYETMADLLRSVEPDDVLSTEYKVLDDEGHGYRLVVEGRGHWRTVQAVPAEATPVDVVLMARLRQEYGPNDDLG